MGNWFGYLLLVVLLVGLVSGESSEDSPKGSNREARERKFRQEQDKKEVISFLNTKNIVKTIVKLLFGSHEESSATSRQVLNVLVKVLDMLRTSFGQRARSSTKSGLRETADAAGVACVLMTKGFVQSYLSGDLQCAQRHICQSSKSAVREGRELGYLIAQVAGYASSYLLENQKEIPFAKTYEAVRRGRSGENCMAHYNCNETD